MAFKLDLTERSYGGKKFRPRPSCYLEKESNLILCVTPWGRDDISETIVDSIKNFLAMANDDQEITVPYARKQNLNRTGNVLRMAIILASEKIHKEYNKDEYTAGFEVFAGLQEGHQWTYVSCGQPSLILLRENMGAIPVHHNIDLNIRAPMKTLSDPLPNHILGMGQHPPIQFGSLSLQKKDKLMLISRSYLPSCFFSMGKDLSDSQKVSQVLAEDDQDIPFWLGLVDLD